MNPEKSIKLSVQIPLFLLLNLVLYFLDLWTNQALMCLVIDVILFGKIVNDAMKLIPVRYKKSSERFVTLLFPILLLSIWEIFASTGKINPTWFPEPTPPLQFWAEANLRKSNFFASNGGVATNKSSRLSILISF